jgi:S-adenosylmethionine decarboxylase proenzyme
MEDLIQSVRAGVKLKEGADAIERVLVSLYFDQPVSTKELARRSSLPVPVVTAVKKEFIKLGVMEQRGGVRLTPKGASCLEEKLGLDGLRKDLYRRLMNDREFREKFAEDLALEAAPVYRGRPRADVTLDQALGTPLTSVRRALLALERHTLLGKRLLCVGDDDLVSVSVGFLLKKLYEDPGKIKTRVTVLEKDARFAEYINTVAQQHGLAADCVELDLRDPLPLGYVGAFDAFYTDPPYTIEGLSLFLSRGIGGLKKERGLKVFLSFGQKPNEELFRLQEVLLAHGLAMTGIHEGFNRYEGASLLGNVSQLMELVTTDHTKAVIPASMANWEKIYTADMRPAGREYRCRACKKILETGKRGRAIEAYQEEGCPGCGGHVFDQLRKHKPPDGKPERNISSGPRKRRALGEHILADFFGCDGETLDDVKKIQEIMREAAHRANAAIVSHEFHRFSPWGVSGAVIIQESHLTIHTWPEHRYAAVDLFTCGESLDLWKAMDYLREKLGCSGMETTEMGRGIFKSGGIDSSGSF